MPKPKATKGTGTKHAHWSEEDLTYLERWYAWFGPARLQQGRLSHYSYSQITWQAAKLGLRVGMMDSRIATRELDAELGMPHLASSRLAREQGVTGKNGSGHVTTVPIEWAERYLAEMRAKLEADKLVGSWYTVQQVARVLNATLPSVYRYAKGENRLGHAFDDLDIRHASTRHDKMLLFNPWQVEALAKALREDRVVISKSQADIILALADGATLEWRAGEGPMDPPQYTLTQDEPRRVKASAVKRCLDKAVLVPLGGATRSYRAFTLTDYGRQVAADMIQMAEEAA